MAKGSVNEWCPHCEEEVKLKAIFKVQICPNCGSEHTYLLRGNEFMIKEISAT